jgi:hypothetical protein
MASFDFPGKRMFLCFQGHIENWACRLRLGRGVMAEALWKGVGRALSESGWRSFPRQTWISLLPVCRWNGTKKDLNDPGLARRGDMGASRVPPLEASQAYGIRDPDNPGGRLSAPKF